MKHPIQIVTIGPEIVELHWPKEISEPILFEILAYKNWLSEQWGTKIQRMYQGYQVLGIQLKPDLDSESCLSELREQLQQSIPKADYHPHVRCWRLPVCYDLRLVPELRQYLEKKSLSQIQFAGHHTTPAYRLYGFGFLPGFMYLGGLDKKLHIPRKTIPDRNISAGSVAIGGSQTGVYPMDSPGGWYVVGKTPVSFFRQGRLQVPFRPGDSIRFESVSLARFEALMQKVPLCWEKWEDHG